MLLTIHNLPLKIRYNDIKLLLQSKCGIEEVILDNLVSDGRVKKVTVGLAEEGDAAILVRKINGLYLEGQQLYVENVRQKKASEQPYRSKDVLGPMANQADCYPRDIPQRDYQQATWDIYKNDDTQQHNLPRDSFQKPDAIQQHNAFPKSNYQGMQPYATQPMVAPDSMAVMMDYNMTPMYYVPAVPNPYLDYGAQAQPAIPQYQGNHVQQQSSFGFGVERDGANEQESRPRDWEQNNSRLYVDKSRQLTQNRGHAPVENFSNRRDSRWDTPRDEPRDARRHSRSPQRVQFNSREPFFVQNNNDTHDHDFPQRNREADYGKRPHGPSETFTSNAFGDPKRSGPVVHLPPSNSFGNRGTQQPRDFPVREIHRDERNQWEHPPSFNTHDIHNRQWRDVSPKQFQPQNDRRPPLNEPDSSQYRNSNFSGSKLDGKQNNAVRVPPPKRFPERRDERDEPQPKRFAAPKPREDFPRPWQQGPQNSQNTSSKPVQVWKDKVQERFSAVPPKLGPPRFDAPLSQPQPIKSAPQPYQMTKSNKPVKILQPKQKLVSLLKRDQTWRGQAASEIAKTIMSTSRIIDKRFRGAILFRLKSIVRSRLEVMVADKISVPTARLVEMYYSKYQAAANKVLLKTVSNDVQKEEMMAKNKQGDKTKTSGVTAEKTSHKENKEENRDTKDKGTKVEVPVIKPLSPSAKLPKYINADKKQLKQLKKIQKLELKDDSLYELTPDLQKTLDEECDVLCDLFMSECEHPDSERDKQICERISDQVADDFRKLVRLNVTKRLLNINTDLAVRVYYRGQASDLPAVETFLKSQGAVSFKKLAKLNTYIAHFHSYENYDAVCAIGEVDFGKGTLKIKPLNLVGPPPRVTRAEVLAQRDSMIQAQIDHSGEKLLEKPGSQPEKPASQHEEPGSQSEEQGVYTDEEQIDKDVEEMVREYAELDDDFQPETEDAGDIACSNVKEESEDADEDIACSNNKEETFEVNENDLEDY